MTLASVDDTFTVLVEPLRRELTAHCYRMLGSISEAEDLVQETYLRAWRALHGFEGRSSVRTWMYTIATNTCLTALEKSSRRPLPTGLGQPASDPGATLQTDHEMSWLEPIPDAVVWGREQPEPGAAVVSRESVRLAFVAALQHLTAQQRAVVILCDVLAWRASEAAEALGISVASVNSSLQRARAHLGKVAPGDTPSAQPDDERSRALFDAYVAAFEAYDVDRIVSLLRADAVWEMPPFTGWFSGPDAIRTLIEANCPAQAAGDIRLVPVRANGQAAFAVYMRDVDGVHRAFQIQHLAIERDEVAHVVAFFDLALFERFGLPAELD